jgi:hypothetical protein
MLLTLALVAISISNCSWNYPGSNPYTGNVPEAVTHYVDIPSSTQTKLRSKMEGFDFDDVVTISRNAISGKGTYSNLRGMHFGKGDICGTPDRSQWSDSLTEIGLVYCADGECVLVPTVCRNVSRVTIQGKETESQETEDGELAQVPTWGGLESPLGAQTGLPAALPSETETGSLTSPYPAFIPSPYPVYPQIFVPNPVPEPSTWIFLITGLIAGYIVWKEKKW